MVSVLFFSALTALQGTGATDGTKAKPEDLCTVEGLAIDAKTQAPLGKADIMLVGERSGNGLRYSARTDASGRFVLTRVGPGRYSVNASRNGYTREGAGRAQVLSLAAGQNLKGMVVRFLPAAVVTGRVVDEDGEPLAWAEVAALRYRYFRGRRQLVPAGGIGMTNDLGEYRLFGMTPGSFYIQAKYDEDRLMGRNRRKSERESGYATMYYPGAENPGQTTPLKLRPGEVRSGVDFRMARVRVVRVSGRVLSQVAGAPLRDTTVLLVPKGSVLMGRGLEMNTRVDSSGKFVITGIRPGSYILSAMQGEARLHARTEVEVVGDNDVQGVELALAPGSTIHGQVKIEGNVPVQTDFEGLRLYLRNSEMAENAFGVGRPSRLGAAGTFEIPGVSAGRYFINVFQMPEDWYLKSVRRGDQDGLNSGVTVLQGVEGPPVEVVLSQLGGRVEGVALDEDKKPAPSVTIALIPEQAKRSREELFKTTTTDQYGRFAIRGVTPGEYKGFAWDRVDEGGYLDPAFVAEYEDDGVKIAIREQSTQTVELKLLTVEVQE